MILTVGETDCYAGAYNFDRNCQCLAAFEPVNFERLCGEIVTDVRLEGRLRGALVGSDKCTIYAFDWTRAPVIGFIAGKVYIGE